MSEIESIKDFLEWKKHINDEELADAFFALKKLEKVRFAIASREDAAERLEEIEKVVSNG